MILTDYNLGLRIEEQCIFFCLYTVMTVHNSQHTLSKMQMDLESLIIIF